MKGAYKILTAAGIFSALIILVAICFIINSGEDMPEVPLVDFTGATTLVHSQENGTELNIQGTIEN